MIVVLNYHRLHKTHNRKAGRYFVAFIGTAYGNITVCCHVSARTVQILLKCTAVVAFLHSPNDVSPDMKMTMDFLYFELTG